MHSMKPIIKSSQWATQRHLLRFFSESTSGLAKQSSSKSDLEKIVLKEKEIFLSGKFTGYLPSPYTAPNFLVDRPVSLNSTLRHDIEPKRGTEKAAKSLINGWIVLVDKMSGYEKQQKSKPIWMSKLVLTEMFLANPILMGSLVYHTKCVMNPGRDVATVSRYLTLADNLRMSFTAMLEIKNPNIFYRLATVLAQGVDLFMCTLILFPAPQLGHRMLAYMLEDALDVYNKCVEEVDKPGSCLSEWKNEQAPKFAIDYWKLKEGKTSVRDLLDAIREDKLKHLVISHTIASISRDEMRPLRQ